LKGRIIISESDGNFGEQPSGKKSIDRLISRWSEIEALLESSGRSSELDERLLEYITDLQKDNTQVQWIRNVIISVATIFIGVLWYYLIVFIKDEWLYFLLIGQNARVAFIVGLFALTGIFLTVVIRGSFKMTKDRHEDNLPSSIQTIVDYVTK